MRSLVHPLSGANYDLQPDGRIRVTKDEKWGLFGTDGSLIEGELRAADPLFCLWLAKGSFRRQIHAPEVLRQKPAPEIQPAPQQVGPPKGIPYQRILDGDTRPVPAFLREQNPLIDAPVEVPVERYTSRAFFDLEVERLWKRVWQMACHEDDIPNVGDHIIYEIVGLSFIVVRVKPDEIKAYVNACLHRGRLLRDGDGKAATEFRCPFHGFAWNLNGSIRNVTCHWDFLDYKPAEWRLPEARIGRWGGFVFLNIDPDCQPFEEFLGPELTAQFARWPLEKRFKKAHVAKVLPCNWKIAQEAFMESFHVVATHPQLLPGNGDVNSQYDAWGNVSRAITAIGVASPHLRGGVSEQRIFDSLTDRRLDEPPVLEVPDGMTARQVAAENARALLRPVLGAEVDRLCDAEMMDSIYYTVFPNFHPWGAYNRQVYRFRPYGTEVDRSIMEVIFLAPYRDGEKPPAAPIHWLTDEEDWSDAAELGFFGQIFIQDSLNLPKLQQGLATTRQRTTRLARYQETKIRHFENLVGRWVSGEKP
jgi:nitrite reductase/ring-hydroxylating ferredoxin subunit